jgi:hypothetical protein
MATVPLYPCFDNVTKDHAVSLFSDCGGVGAVEFE